MEDTATPETGPVDAPASDNSIESIVAEIQSGGGNEPAEGVEAVTQELVNEAEGNGEPDEGPGTEDDATDPAEEAAEPEESPPEESEAPDPFAKLVTENPDLTVKVKVNGETIEVPIAELTNGYSRTEDYKAKTAALADERRQVEQQRETVEATVKAEYANQLEEATNLFAQFDPVLSEAQKIDWNALKQADPAAFVAAQDAVNERLTAIQQMKQQVESLREQTSQRQAQEAERERAERFDKAAEEIVKLRPDLADEAKFSAFASEAVEGLKGYGFSGEEIVDVLDHRVLQLIDDARYGRAQREAAKALPPQKVVPKSAVKPLTSDGSGSRASTPRFPAKADRHAKGAYIANQILEGL
jgi:hypothetical protein